MKPELFLTDLKVAARSLWRSKGLAATVIVTLALRLGANAAIFSVVRGVLLRRSTIAMKTASSTFARPPRHRRR